MNIKNKVCYIFGSCEAAQNAFDLTRNRENALFIAADNGFNEMKRIAITPDIILGDFDSAPLTEEMKNCGASIVRHPVEKDDTDLMLAIKVAFERGYRDFIIFGCLGGDRFDHSIATLQSLAYIASHGGKATAFGKGDNGKVLCATVIKDSRIEFSSEMSGYVSVFSTVEKSEGVTLKGLKYPLTGATVSSFFPLGVSNAFTGEQSSIEVKNGTLLILYNK